jgi:hypothetical protein
VAEKQMLGLSKTEPFFVEFCAAPKVPISAKKIAKNTLGPRCTQPHKNTNKKLKTRSPEGID